MSIFSYMYTFEIEEAYMAYLYKSTFYFVHNKQTFPKYEEKSFTTQKACKF